MFTLADNSKNQRRVTPTEPTHVINQSFTRIVQLSKAYDLPNFSSLPISGNRCENFNEVKFFLNRGLMFAFENESVRKVTFNHEPNPAEELALPSCFWPVAFWPSLLFLCKDYDFLRDVEGMRWRVCNMTEIMKQCYDVELTRRAVQYWYTANASVLNLKFAVENLRIFAPCVTSARMYEKFVLGSSEEVVEASLFSFCVNHLDMDWWFNNRAALKSKVISRHGWPCPRDDADVNKKRWAWCNASHSSILSFGLVLHKKALITGLIKGPNLASRQEYIRISHSNSV